MAAAPSQGPWEELAAAGLPRSHPLTGRSFVQPGLSDYSG